MDIGKRGLLRLLGEGMQHVDLIPDVRHIEDAVCTRLLANSDFSDTRTNGWHRLPVLGIKTVLHTVQLITSFPSRVLARRATIGKRPGPSLIRSPAGSGFALMAA